MTLPAVETLCDALDLAVQDLCITLPGGTSVCATPELQTPNLFGLAKTGLGQANAALAPFQPVFDIIETINAVLDCIQAIPDAIASVPPDPTGLVECVPNLIEKVQALLKYIPQLAVPQLIKDILGAIIALLQGIVQELAAIQQLEQQILAASELAEQAPGLLAALDCAGTSLDNQIGNLARAIGSFNILIDLLNLLGGLVGLPEIPSFDGGLGDAIQPAIDVLNDVIDVLKQLRDLIPGSDNIPGL